MTNVDRDIKNALKVIKQIDFKPFIKFSNVSSVFRGTNENINGYSNCYIGTRNVLTVIGSGDQVLNAIYYGTTNIDAFDISSFAGYFFKLKLAAVKELSYYEFLDFFYGVDCFDDERFNRITNRLDDETKYFWRSVCKDIKPSDVYSSYLFSRWKPTERNAVERNPFLATEHAYNALKSNLDNSRVNIINADIYELSNKLDKDYDFINLSNICMYADSHNESIIRNQAAHDFKKMVTNLRITPKGCVMNYLLDAFRASTSIYYREHVFVGDNFSIDYIKGDDFYKIDGVSVYRKKM
jgi:S-adenosylmethionine:diacylglycerol 3-amino-3-carboxypropyl transferase